MNAIPQMGSSDMEKGPAAHLSAARALLDASTQVFFDALYAGVALEDVQDYSPQQLADLARGLLEQLHRHAPGAIDVTQQQIAGLPVLLGVNDDRPFLFDSGLAAAIAGGARPRAAFHPIVDGVSLIALVLDQPAPAAALEAMTAAFEQGRLAVRDWHAMMARLGGARAELAGRGGAAEDLDFLDWLGADHFTFLGARDYRLTREDGETRLEPVDGSGIGILADANARVIHAGTERAGLSQDVIAYLNEPEALIVTKSHAHSQVHRRAHLDYIGIKQFDSDGRFVGEHRFVGLFTSTAYSAPAHDIPLLRLKIAQVMARAGLALNLAPASHDGKALAHILDTFPRDELFQISADELYDIALGILKLGGLARVRLFLRFDRFDRFVSALLFAPRDHITTQVRDRIHALLAKTFNGRTSAVTAALDEGQLVRLHYIVGREPGLRPKADARALERQITALIETWDDAFARALCATSGTAEGLRRLTARAARFSPGYRDMFPAHEAARDLEVLEQLAQSDGLKLKARVYRKADDAHDALRLKLFVLGDVLPLSASLPVFENLGLKVIAEDGFPVSFAQDDGWRQDAMILDFTMARADGLAADPDQIGVALQDAFHAVMRGEAESDGFNRLVMAANLNWRDVVILRAVGKFLRQAGMTLSLAYMQQALTRNPDLAALLVSLFYLRCEPGADSQRGERGIQMQDAHARLAAALKDVPSLDDDRIIRRFANVIDNVLRTNFWQHKPYVSLKLDSAKLDELPAPRPWREIFVYAPSMEGVHLRFGKVARGGIRWSDRREDFRTEILGLVKAQQVKNAVIVPVGAKGGFFPKQMPANPTREESMAVGIAAYKTLITAMLEITDNLAPDGAIVPPPDVLRLDGDDPYLVVAADKGTATFSDIANGIAIDHDFWLGDAFASGGSQGYDHKKMGITARGAWEAIKRHFRELGTDIQAQDFTVIGVGDMSGDVFGNGMLLSKHIRLVAAFDHRHIFLDPNADAATGFAERERLFVLPRSSWDDYNKALIGQGGGVFARTLKEIPLSPEVQALIGTSAASLTPTALINALLKAKADLLWFGGIGTYVKAASQSQADAGDRANDVLRVNGAEVRARVIGEGANLGVTQLGRIEYAKAGGRIDTDAVDNSAGVDTSDHEVNLKILVSGPVRRGELQEDQRDTLLAAMTDDVARLVLADNYDQTLALSVAQSVAARDLDAAGRFMRDLESRGRLDRGVEFLPADAVLRALAQDKKGLTRPELAVLLAYAKLDLDAEILASSLPDDPAFAALLDSYFPPLVLQSFPQEPQRHRLKREIVSTMLANNLVNLAGPLFAFRMREFSGATGADVTRAFMVAEGAYGLLALKTRIDALDGKVDAAVQTALYQAIADHARAVTPWFIAHLRTDTKIEDAIALYRAGIDNLRARAAQKLDTSAFAGAPDDVARDVALLVRLVQAPDVIDLAGGQGSDAMAALYFALGTHLGIDRLREQAAKLAPSEHWDRLALRRLLDDLAMAQKRIAAELIAKLPGGGDATAVMASWQQAHAAALAQSADFLQAVSGELSVAKLMLAASQIQKLA